jgi:hypothetical protein
VLKKDFLRPLREDPGPKLLEFIGLFRGLKAPAPSERQELRLFQQPIKPIDVIGLFVGRPKAKALGYQPHAPSEKQQQRLFSNLFRSWLLSLVLVGLKFHVNSNYRTESQMLN